MILWHSRLTLRTKDTIYLLSLRSVLTYAASAWLSLLSTTMCRLEQFLNRTLRSFSGSPWFIRNDAIHTGFRVPTHTDLVPRWPLLSSSRPTPHPFHWTKSQPLSRRSKRSVHRFLSGPFFPTWHLSFFSDAGAVLIGTRRYWLPHSTDPHCRRLFGFCVATMHAQAALCKRPSLVLAPFWSYLMSSPMAVTCSMPSPASPPKRWTSLWAAIRHGGT